MFLTRELFVETIEAIKKQNEHDIKCSEAMGVIYPDSFEAGMLYENHYVMNQIVKLLQVAFDDETEHSLIEYFMWELDFGKKDKKLSAYRADKSKIDLSDAGKLYDYLTENIAENG